MRRRNGNRVSPEIGEQLRERREQLGLSQRDVADRTDGQLSYAAMSRIETGARYPTLHTLEYLCQALHCVIVIDETGTTVSW